MPVSRRTGFTTEPQLSEEAKIMARAYNVIDSDGHILEPLTLWNDYMDPAFRDRAPKLVIDKDGKQRLLVEEQILGSQAGYGRQREQGFGRFGGAIDRQRC